MDPITALMDLITGHRTAGPTGPRTAILMVPMAPTVLMAPMVPTARLTEGHTGLHMATQTGLMAHLTATPMGPRTGTMAPMDLPMAPTTARPMGPLTGLHSPRAGLRRCRAPLGPHTLAWVGSVVP